MLRPFDRIERTTTNDASKDSQRLNQDAIRVGFGFRFHRVHDVAQQTVQASRIKRRPFLRFWQRQTIEFIRIRSRRDVDRRSLVLRRQAGQDSHHFRFFQRRRTAFRPSNSHWLDVVGIFTTSQMHADQFAERGVSLSFANAGMGGKVFGRWLNLEHDAVGTAFNALAVASATAQHFQQP